MAERPFKGKQIRRICSVPGCRNTATVIMTRNNDFGTARCPILCADCLNAALGCFDTTAPTITAGGSSAITASGATINFTSSEAGTYYYVLQLSASMAPVNADAVINASVGGNILDAGSGSAAASTNSFDLSGLTASTAYKAYIVAKDSWGNASAVTAVTFSTTA